MDAAALETCDDIVAIDVKCRCWLPRTDRCRTSTGESSGFGSDGRPITYPHAITCNDAGVRS